MGFDYHSINKSRNEIINSKSRTKAINYTTTSDNRDRIGIEIRVHPSPTLFPVKLIFKERTIIYLVEIVVATGGHLLGTFNELGKSYVIVFTQ